MKKLFLLPIVLIMLYACETNQDEIIIETATQQEGITPSSARTVSRIVPYFNEEWAGLTCFGFTHVEVKIINKTDNVISPSSSFLADYYAFDHASLPKKNDKPVASDILFHSTFVSGVDLQPKGDPASITVFKESCDGVAFDGHRALETYAHSGEYYGVFKALEIRANGINAKIFTHQLSLAHGDVEVIVEDNAIEVNYISLDFYDVFFADGTTSRLRKD